MSARSLLMAALSLTVAAPLAAQDIEPVWSSERPDGVAPIGVFGDRTVPAGTLELHGQFAKTSMEGIRFDDQLVDPLTLFDVFQIVPIGLTIDAYLVRAAFGLTDRLTLTGRAGFEMRKREQILEDFTYFVMESRGLTDIEGQVLFNVIDQGGIRAHLHAGLTVPTGSVVVTDDVVGVRPNGTLPYDMQLGSGAWGISPGITAQMMNDVGSVGGQVVATRYFLEKESWRLGDKLEATWWAAYRLNDYFSASARMHLLSFGPIDGFDPGLIPERDPGEWPISYAGTRVDLPVGLNLYMPEGSWAGHRLSVEFVFPVHEHFDGPWISMTRAITAAYQITF